MNQQYEDIYGNVFSIDKELSSVDRVLFTKQKSLMCF